MEKAEDMYDIDYIKRLVNGPGSGNVLQNKGIEAIVKEKNTEKQPAKESIDSKQIYPLGNMPYGLVIES